jgi:hypothetical protein
MSPLFKKLNLGSQSTLYILEAPDSFDAELAQLTGLEIRRTYARGAKIEFALAFATSQTNLDALSAKIASAVEGDAIIWIAYPKGTSKKYQCDFNRDTGWTVIGNAGFEPVRQVAIDADWSALRFRKTEFIKKLNRSQSMAISPEGKQRAPKR